MSAAFKPYVYQIGPHRVFVGNGQVPIASDCVGSPFHVGDVILNLESPGSTKYLICTAAGKPGTWSTVSDLSTIGGPIADMTYTLTANVTTAQINAGTTILAEATGKVITVVGVLAISHGAFAACTDVRLCDTTGTPVEIMTIPVASLTDGAVINEASSNIVMGAGFFTALASGKGLKVRKTGSTATTGTSIDFIVRYKKA